MSGQNSNIRQSSGQRIRRWVMNCAAIIAAVIFAYFSWHHWQEIPTIKWSAHSIGILLGASLLSAFTVAVNGVIWWLLLRDAGQRVRIMWACNVVAISQFGKYLPGNVAQHVGRVVLAGNAGLPLPVTLTTMVLEVLWGAGVGTVLALLGVWLHLGGHIDIAGNHLPAPLLLLLAAILILGPWTGISLFQRLTPNIIRKLTRGHDIQLPRLRVAVAACILFTFNFLTLGAILKLLAVGLLNITAGHWLQLSCLFAAAWVAGYVLPGAPGGLGARESMMLALFTPLFGTGAAISIGVMLRIATSLGDLLAYATALCDTKNPPKNMGRIE